MRNKDPFAPWNGFEKNDPFAPWNGIDKNDPWAPWNDPFGHDMSGRYPEYDRDNW